MGWGRVYWWLLCCFLKSNSELFLFFVLRYFLTNRFMVYMYNQGSTSFHSPNIPVRFKLLYEFSKNFKITEWLVSQHTRLTSHWGYTQGTYCLVMKCLLHLGRVMLVDWGSSMGTACSLLLHPSFTRTVDINESEMSRLRTREHWSTDQNPSHPLPAAYIHISILLCPACVLCPSVSLAVQTWEVCTLDLLSSKVICWNILIWVCVSCVFTIASLWLFSFGSVLSSECVWSMVPSCSHHTSSIPLLLEVTCFVLAWLPSSPFPAPPGPLSFQSLTR